MSSKAYQRLKLEESLAAAQKKAPQTIPVPEPKPHTEFTDAADWARIIREES